MSRHPSPEGNRLNPRWLGELPCQALQPSARTRTPPSSATITAISAPREVTTSRGASQVADATLQDETGTTTLTLWGEDIQRYSVGQKVQITDGWVKDFRGKLQVSMGRSGKISVVPVRAVLPSSARRRVTPGSRVRARPTPGSR